MAATAAASLGLLLFPALALAGVSLCPGVAAGAGETTATGLVFNIGGPRGWRVPDDGTDYGMWAMNNRCHGGDRLYFKYSHDDSVLLVDRAAYDECNATAPLAAHAGDGNATSFILDRPGFFYFISGKRGHCVMGQRLILRVMVHPVGGAPAPTPRAAFGPAASGPASVPAPSGPAFVRRQRAQPPCRRRRAQLPGRRRRAQPPGRWPRAQHPGRRRRAKYRGRHRQALRRAQLPNRRHRAQPLGRRRSRAATDAHPLAALAQRLRPPAALSRLQSLFSSATS